MYFNIILPVHSPKDYAYTIMLYNASYDHSHMPLHCPRNKRKEKEKSNLKK